MRHQDIRLLAQARDGDMAARFEVGRRYLVGADGFPKHVATGIDYLTHPSVKALAQANQIIVESLPLQDILSLREEGSLRIAASAGVRSAQAKLGAWLCISKRDLGDGQAWLERAAGAGHAGATAAMQAVKANSPAVRTAVLLALARSGDLDARQLALRAARDALAASDLDLLDAILPCVLALAPVAATEVSELVLASLRLAGQKCRTSLAVEPALIGQCLEARAARSDVEAAFILGRALCGIHCGSLPATALVAGPNMRRGAALLLRAADAGCDDAWMHLYRVHADHHCSVANPQMALFFLEKAATREQIGAQRRLGALMLRSSSSLEDTEQGIHWLHAAATKGDTAAMRLLESLVLPVQGEEDEAGVVIEAVRRADPWLAARLRVARDFGLTRLEALSVDLFGGLRPWGLVVGRNPFIHQTKLSAPRAVPAVSKATLQNLRRAAAFFEQARQDAGAIEGDLRKRSARLRRALERHRIQDSMFFAQASSTTLDAMRQGPKWAFRARAPLALALAA